MGATEAKNWLNAGPGETEGYITADDIKSAIDRIYLDMPTSSGGGTTPTTALLPNIGPATFSGDLTITGQTTTARAAVTSSLTVAGQQITGWVEPITTPTTEITDCTNTRIREILVKDDSTDTTKWPDRIQFRYAPPGAGINASVRTGGFNEYGELRADCAKVNTVAFRAHGDQSGAHIGPILAVRNKRGGGVDMFTVTLAGAQVIGTLTVNGNPVVTKAELKTKVAAATDWPTFQAAIAAW
jgi:hypothetical protein